MAGEHAARGASDELLERVRAICLAFPEATEGGGVGNPSWRVRDKTFAIVADLIEEAYRMTAPKRLVSALDAQRPGG